MPGAHDSKTKSATSRQMTAVIVAVIVAALVIFGGGAYLFTRLFAGATVRSVDMDKTMQLVAGEYNDPLEATGTIRAASGVSVSPGVDGTVKKVNVKDGSKVAKGAVLFTMENDELVQSADEADKAYQKAYAVQEKAQSTYTKALANVKSAKKKLAAAKKAFEKQQSEAAGGEDAASQAKPAFDSEPYDTAIAYAQEAQDNAKESLDAAKDNAAAAKKAYEDAKKKVSALTVKAERAGTITDLKVEPGMTSAMVNAQGAALRIIDLETLVAVVEVGETQINSIRLNQTGSVRADTAAGGASFNATVSKVSDTPATDAGEGAEARYEVQLTLDDPSSQLKDGMAVTVQIKVTDYGVVYYVPLGALGENATGSYVEVVYNDKTTKQVQVTVLGRSEDGSQAAIQGTGVSKDTTVRTDVTQTGE